MMKSKLVCKSSSTSLAGNTNTARVTVKGIVHTTSKKNHLVICIMILFYLLNFLLCIFSDILLFCFISSHDQLLFFIKTTQTEFLFFLSHWIRTAVLNSSPRAPPLCIFRMLLLSLQMFVLFERKCPSKWTSQDIPPWFQFEVNVYIFHSKCI